MRSYDPATKRPLSHITIFLTPDEARELADSAADLAAHPKKQHHHVADASFEREVTIAVYTPETLDTFDLESQQLLRT